MPDTDSLIDLTNYVTSYPPDLPSDVARVDFKSGIPTTARMDWEQYKSEWYKDTVVAIDTNVDIVQSITDDATASIETETFARTSADSAAAANIQTLSTAIGAQTAQLTLDQQSVNGLAVRYGVTGYINGVTGGFVFTGVLRNDGTVAYDMEITANTIIRGDLFVSGTITTGAIAQQAIDVPYYTVATGTNSQGPDGTWRDVLVTNIQGGNGSFALVSFTFGACFAAGTSAANLRLRVYSDQTGNLTGDLGFVTGACDSSGNPAAASGYAVTAGFCFHYNIPATDTLRLQVKNTGATTAGRVWWNQLSKLLVEVRLK